MKGINKEGHVSYLKPTPLTDAEYKAMVIKHEEEKQERLSLLDDRIVEAKLYYYKGIRNGSTCTQEQMIHTTNLKPVYTPDINLEAYGEAVVIGTDRQRCEDDTFEKVTGIYSLNLTMKMLRAYEANNNKLIITKQF
jgi:hypothetical protein